ncbi:chemotaxis protein CheW [Xanthomonas hortorum pv. vitians]|uniref:chemotaxis protein CheW n=1 Tax=Xanthomonas hortorum TaxID=56454 RepID=UPI001F44FB49|nr:chemotaxis protein CheW [Xanthomonas hortorum]MCE4311454.1 chemotaxis protein CheW [Xanthomonas hortorum pv. vitians]MCE4533460.1 chemotaxis protein CheW [Xanthomonas hortorum pv. vitians]
MSNHTANGELDDYLEGLLHDAGVEIPAAVTAAAVTAAVATADIAATPALADTDADVALAEPPVQAVAVPEAIAPVLSAEAIAADFLAEMDADPAFATAAPSPFMSTADLMAEMDADPAFGTAASSADLLAVDLLSEMDADPAFGLAAPPAPAPARPAQAPIAPHRAPPPSIYPQGLEALLAPGQAERIHAERRAAERSTRWLRLRCGEQTYALELLKVQEVVLPVPLLPLRGTPSAMLGIMNLRGQVVPVMDLGIHLGASAVDMDLHTRVVVLEENGETMGLRVSAVEDVTSLTDQQIEPPDNARLCRISNNLFRGVARLGHQPMILLDASHLLH